MAKTKQAAKTVTLDQIKKAHGPRFTEIDVPEWGEGAKVLAKRLGAPEYIRINAGKPDGKLEGQAAFDYFLTVVQSSLVNADGSQLIDDENLYLLADYPNMVTRIGKQLLEYNGLIGEGARKN